MRLFAEFENFKKRTAKERMDLYKTAGESVLSSLLPILDDFERSIKANEKEDEGVVLIYNKMKSTLESKGLKAMDNPIGLELNTVTITKLSLIYLHPLKILKEKLLMWLKKAIF